MVASPHDAAALHCVRRCLRPGPGRDAAGLRTHRGRRRRTASPAVRPRLLEALHRLVRGERLFPLRQPDVERAAVSERHPRPRQADAPGPACTSASGRSRTTRTWPRSGPRWRSSSTSAAATSTCSSMYKALFELASDRADFVSMLFAKPRPAGLTSKSSVAQIFSAFSRIAHERGAVSADTQGD